MSAFFVGKHHVDIIISAAIDYDAYAGPPRPERVTHERASIVGRMLLAENLRSMLHRYAQLVGSEEATAYQTEVDGYRHRHYPRVRLSAAAQAISCYDYQACEHPEYRDSHARAFVESLRDALLSRLPGIGDERWGIDSAEQAASTTIFSQSAPRG